MDLCPDDEVQQAILTTDGNCLAPICEVVRMTEHPTEVVVEQKGRAEKVGDAWVVRTPIKLKLV